jgi:nicotinate-nucleotide pyrophosphorylase (carboxylating)
MALSPLPDLLLEPLVRAALQEDLGRAGDLTSDAVVPMDTSAELVLVAREAGVLAGLDLARLAFAAVDPRAILRPRLADGTRLAAGDQVAVVTGPTRALLTAERTALNFVGHLSGVATATATIADAIAHTPARVCCTRKTTPGLRALEKYAVRAGGGVNHRFGLDDAVLIKDNHIALGGGLAETVRRARAAAGHLVAIEVEVDSLEQLAELLTGPGAPVDAVLLDNMAPVDAAEAVRMVRQHDGAARVPSSSAGRRTVVEASGRVTAATAPALAEAGVDLVSAGWITHSAPSLDLGLDTA